jgi:NADPH-dependent 2,4-dienoyl-CoA reductase/sulfur reductase-like enzyme
VKLLYREDDRRLVGAVLAGRDLALAKRCDVLATAITAKMTIDEVSELDLTYAPPFSPVWDPILRTAGKAGFGD